MLLVVHQTGTRSTMKTMRSALHASKIVDSVARLRDGRGDRFSDVLIKIDDSTFPCHRLVLLLSSEDFFENILASTTPASKDAISLPQFTDPDIFNDVLTFIYTGEVNLSEENVEDVLAAADKISLQDLKHLCVEYMLETLDGGTCLRYWRCALENKEEKLTEQTYSVVRKDFTSTVGSKKSMTYVTERMMKAMLDDEEVNIDDEVQMIEAMLRWIRIQKDIGATIHVDELLPLIRWSGVHVEYIKSKLLSNTSLTSNPASFWFLTNVISFLLSGTPFEGLQTFYRPATGLEKDFVSTVIGNDDGGSGGSLDMCSFSLQRNSDVTSVRDCPFSLVTEFAGCVNNNMFFTVGVGEKRKEIWRYDHVSGWTRRTDLVIAKSRHCVASVGSNLYTFGGCSAFDELTLDSVEQFNTLTNKSKEIGKLTHAVHSAGCATFRNCIYVFGGFKSDEVDYVQVFDTASNSCSQLTQSMPQPSCLLRAVVWQTSAILFSPDSCFIFDFAKETWQERHQYGTGVSHFGVALEGQAVYIVGGGAHAGPQGEYTLTDDVKYVKVIDVLQDLPAIWSSHVKLKCPGMISAYGVMTLPT